MNKLIKGSWVLIIASILFATPGAADDYTADLIFVKFNQDVEPEIITGVVSTGIDSVDALNEQYGVYDFEQMFPMPGTPLEHPDGLWDWGDYTAAYDEFKLGRIFLFYFPTVYKNIKGAAASYDQLPEVEYAHLDWYCQLTALPNDPEYKNLNQWYLYKIKAEPAWDTSKGTDVVIAILDTGVAHEHPDLDGKIVAGYDFVNDDNDPEDESLGCHGTMISGLAAAETNNGVGIAALGWESQIMPLQVTEWKGNGIPPAPDASVRFCAKAVKWAVDHYAHVINMSFGGNPNFQCWGMEAFKDGCGFAYKLNLILTASAGNNPAYGVHFPARWGPVIAVGATDENDTRWEKSSYGPEMELCAPGVNILTTLKTGPSSFSYGRGTGTSMSAPLVAATAALCRAKWPAATAAQIRKIMQGFSDDLGKTGFDWEYGYGRINPARIFKAAEGKTLTEVVAAAEEEIEERNALGVRYGAYVDPSIPNAVAEP